MTVSSRRHPKWAVRAVPNPIRTTFFAHDSASIEVTMGSSSATEPSDDAIREAAREARTHAAVAVAGAAALLVGLAVVDTWRNWSLLGLPWWTWLTLAVPEGTLLLAFLVWGS